MKQAKQTILALAASLLIALAGCRSQEIDPPANASGTIVLPNGQLQIPLHLNLPAMAEQNITTRSETPKNTAEQQIDNIWVAVFEDNTGGTGDLPDDAKLLQKKSATAAGLTGSYVVLDPVAVPCRLRLIVNASSATVGILNAYTPGITTFGTYGTAAGVNLYKDLTESITELYSGATAANFTPNATAPFPMSSEGVYLATGINATSSFNLDLTADYARIDILNTANLTNFTLAGTTNGAKLLNGARGCYIRRRTPVPLNLGSIYAYNYKAATDANTISPIYLYPNNGASPIGGTQGTNPTDLIVRGYYNGSTTVGYYKIRIHYDQLGTRTFDINRNTLYKVNITKAFGPGYASELEAINNQPANLDYAIQTITDPSATDMVVTNGQYYLATDLSNLVVYDYTAGTAVTNFPLFTLTHNAPSTVTTAPTITGTTGITALTGINGTRNGTQQSINITANLAATFTTGTVTIRLGDLTKVITITRLPLDAHTLNGANLGTGYTAAEVIATNTPGDNSWHTLTTSPLGSMHASVTKPYGTLDPANNLYITTTDYLPTTPDQLNNSGNNLMPRTATIRLTGANGTTTVRLNQPIAYYAGLFGGTFDASASGTGYSKPLFYERIEESGVMQWFNSTATFVNTAATLDKAHGRASTLHLASLNPLYAAATYCRNKNRDTDGDGIIQDSEVVWYLPAQNQLMGAWIYNTAQTSNPFATTNDYWSATEHFAANSWHLNLGYGYSIDNNKEINFRVRCVRDLTP